MDPSLEVTVERRIDSMASPEVMAALDRPDPAFDQWVFACNPVL
jgi:hypothetical protein